MSHSIATTALAGQSIGARSIDNAKAAASIGRRLTLEWMLLAARSYVLRTRQIVGTFSDDRAVLNIGTRSLSAIAAILPFWGGGVVPRERCAAAAIREAR